MTELIITEKPAAALKIADALADKTPKKVSNKGVAYYEIQHNGKEILVGCAVGHLYTVGEKTKKAGYPSFDIEWQPNHEKSAAAKFTKKYLDTLKRLSKKADEFTVACDYDIEGSTIGANCVLLIAKQKDARRMKFSTLTKKELVQAYEHASPHLDWPQIEAGFTRHYLDWMWGINTSRALTNSIKNAGKGYKTMSSGRVQGPALKIIVDREREIKKFVPEPYWQIQLLGKAEKKDFEAWHKEDKFTKEDKASKIFEKIKNEKSATVVNTKKSKIKQAPPFPFDLTSLQTESYKVLHIQPKQTLQLAQSLYLAGLISYPRTSSQQLPPSIDYKKILADLSRQNQYATLCKELLKGSLKPNNGKKKDPAHPAIYPTGEAKSLSGQEAKLYDLIVKRTLATFATAAIRETQKIDLGVQKEIFILKGTTTIEKNWHRFYEPYVKLKEEEIPSLSKGDVVDVKKIDMLRKETLPPKRFTPSSIIKKMETLGLGTKATRSSIVDTLFERNYLKGTSIEATDLGIMVIETLEKYCPDIIDVNLTEHFEKEMEEIQENKRKRQDVLKEAEKELVKIFDDFKKKEKEIGNSLADANIKTRDEASIVGTCNKCQKDLKIMYSRKNKQYFIACSGYPNCRNTFSIPAGMPKPSGKTCKECSSPVVTMIRKGKRPYEYCLNKGCKLKEEYFNKLAVKAKKK